MPPGGHDRTIDGIALKIEDHCPELQGRLISHVQFSRATDAGRYVGSPELVAALDDETMAMADVALLRRHRRHASFPARRGAALRYRVPAGRVCRYGSMGPPRRSCAASPLGQAAYPAATRLVAVEAPETVPIGEAFTVTAIVDSHGVVPQQSWIQVRTAAPGDTFSVPMPAEPAADDSALRRFSAVVENPTEDMEVRVVAFDARSNWQRVRVLRRPSVLQVRLRYVFPDYTALQPRESKEGDITAVIGTRVLLTAHTGKEIRRATADLPAAYRTSTDGRPHGPGGCHPACGRTHRPHQRNLHDPARGHRRPGQYCAAGMDGRGLDRSGAGCGYYLPCAGPHGNAVSTLAVAFLSEGRFRTQPRLLLLRDPGPAAEPIRWPQAAATWAP